MILPAATFVLAFYMASSQGCCPPPPPPDPALGCLTGHSDYVTGLAGSASSGMLASGGLRGEVLLWDLQKLQQVMAGNVPVSGIRAVRLQ